ncbi:uncharacterized protein LOC132992622 [Labrus mixtus]|uniref:uncharacterized protein LOC132992622 n=1 Tax=Labrus mixtus TaxID=508554 RepID=UPI0029C089DE|nr:uncharacterized protein LOC132992622 [Labrus mixtus]
MAPGLPNPLPWHSPALPTFFVGAAYISSSQSCRGVRHLPALNQRVIAATQHPIDFIQDLRDVLRKTSDRTQSEMKLLAIAVVIVLLTTASAKPFRGRWGHKGDIRDNGNKYRKQGWVKWWNWWCNQTSSEEGSSSDHSEESSESSEDSSEEVLIPDLTTPVMTTTTTMSTITTQDKSTLSPGPVTVTTHQPTASPPATTPTTPVMVTSPISVTQNVTQGSPTAAPITDNRGDS